MYTEFVAAGEPGARDRGTTMSCKSAMTCLMHSASMAKALSDILSVYYYAKQGMRNLTLL